MHRPVFAPSPAATPEYAAATSATAHQGTDLGILVPGVPAAPSPLLRGLPGATAGFRPTRPRRDPSEFATRAVEDLLVDVSGVLPLSARAPAVLQETAPGSLVLDRCSDLP